MMRPSETENSIANTFNLVGVSSEIVFIDIGRKTFKTTKATIEKGGSDWLVNNMLKYRTTSSEPLFFDRDPSFFKSILRFLRIGYIDIDKEEMEEFKKEVDFYGLDCLLKLIETNEKASTENSEQEEKNKALGQRFLAFPMILKCLWF